MSVRPSVRSTLGNELGPVALALAFFLVVQPALAIAPSNVRICDPSADCVANVKVALQSYSTTAYLQFGAGSAGGFFNSAKTTGITRFAFINFTNLALGSAANPSQSFGVGMSSSNATLTGITATTVSFTSIYNVTQFTTHPPKLYFYYPNVYASPIPPVTTVNSLAISQSSYYISAGAFNACSSYCVFLNSANNTMIVKATSGTTLNSVFCVFACGSGGGGGAGSFGLVLIAVILIGFMLIAVAVAFVRPRRR